MIKTNNEIDEIIIIGGDHHNTLSVIRCFSKYNCNIIVLIHTEVTEISRIRCSKSRYARGKTFIVNENEREIVSWLEKRRKDVNQYIFPCSDLAAYVLDINKSILSQWYYIPGFLDDNISISYLMNKWNQEELAIKLSVNTPLTWKYSFKDDFPDDIVFPCILKPTISANGFKSDIVRVDHSDCLESTICLLKEKGYEEILIQEYIDYDMQYLACGCILPNANENIGTCFCKVRESKNGSTGLGEVTNECDVISQNDLIIKYLQEHKYWGCYDIEYFRKGEMIFLNEINLRHSGAGCLLIDNDIPVPFYWYLDYEHNEIPKYFELNAGTRFISEIDDLNNVKTKKIGIGRWLSDYIHTKSHTIFNPQDISGTLAFYSNFIHIIIMKAFKRD